MNWNDLREGDIVVPTNLDGNLWLVLDISSNEEHPRLMTYLNLGVGSVHFATRGTDGFDPKVQILRDGENVNT